MAVTMKNVVFRDITPCGSSKNRRFGGTYRLHHQVDKSRWTRKMLAATSNRSMLRRSKKYFFVATNVVPSSPTLVNLFMEALISSKSRFIQESHGVTSQKTVFFTHTHTHTHMMPTHMYYLFACSSSTQDAITSTDTHLLVHSHCFLIPNTNIHRIDM
jgi:hypothetical protein